jgi:signal recognition particle receptor subunit alpha
VGNEAVDQLTKFNRSLRDFSGLSNAKARGIDGMILTKMDIIDDKVRYLFAWNGRNGPR